MKIADAMKRCTKVMNANGPMEVGSGGGVRVRAMPS